MSIYMANVTQREKAKAAAYGAGLGTLGMLAFHIPPSKNRYVETAFNVFKDEAADNIENLNSSALTITEGKNLSGEQKLFLSQFGVNEDVVEINSKIKTIKDSITDTDSIKNLRQTFVDTFGTFKKNPAARDALSIKVFNRIRWSNFAWGVGLGVVLGVALGLLRVQDPKMSYFE